MVVPQPVVVGVASAPDENSGRNRTMVSSTSISAFITKAKDTADTLSLAAVPSPSVLVMSLVGSAVEVAMDVAEMSPGAVAMVAATVRLFKFADCETTLVVTPLVTVISHNVNAFNFAPPTCSVSAAVLEPEDAVVPEKVLDPHPDVVIPPKVEKLNLGKTTIKVSEIASGAFTLNWSLTSDGVAVMGVAISRADDMKRVGSSVEIGMVVTGMFALAPCKVNCTVLPGKLAACACTGVVTPVETVRMQSVPAARFPPEEPMTRPAVAPAS